MPSTPDGMYRADRRRTVVTVSSGAILGGFVFALFNVVDPPRPGTWSVGPEFGIVIGVVSGTPNSRTSSPPPIGDGEEARPRRGLSQEPGGEIVERCERPDRSDRDRTVWDVMTADVVAVPEG